MSKQSSRALVLRVELVVGGIVHVPVDRIRAIATGTPDLLPGTAAVHVAELVGGFFVVKDGARTLATYLQALDAVVRPVLLPGEESS